MVSEKCALKVANLISCYHHGFAGGSKNTSRLLNALSQDDCNVNAYFFEMPHYFENKKSLVKTHVISQPDVNSEVINFSATKNYFASERIVRQLVQTENNVLFGANLFPYCNILLDAKTQFEHSYRRQPKLVIHPVGSDIWQIGRELKSRVKWLLESPLVNSVMTYSDEFVFEITEHFNIRREITVLPPVLESDTFFPLRRQEIACRRNELGLGEDFFVIHHHSSMRKIKCPQVVLRIAMLAAQLISQKCVLVMVGPIPYHVIKSMNLPFVDFNSDKIFKHKSQLENLTIYWTGVLANVEYTLQIADVEINASMHDSFNLALMEALACGVPVVTSNIVGIRKYVELVEGGHCFPTRRLNFDEISQHLACGKDQNDLFDIDYAVMSLIEIEKNRAEWQNKSEIVSNKIAEAFDPKVVTNKFYMNVS